MSNNITLTITLDEAQAEAYLRWLTSQYENLMADCWYGDRYRHVQSGFRGERIFRDYPHIAGVAHTKRELVKQLNRCGGLAR